VAWEDLAPSEISVVLDMPAATVRSHLRRARLALSSQPNVVTASLRIKHTEET
jgi:DNA-directed RNA polymerase specialized sigma24 family protein